MAVTLELERPAPTPDVFTRADLEFRGVDHSGPSFEARIFLDNRRASADTPRDESEGYAGSFWVFGHGGCFGELGHCDIPEGPRGPFDRRPAHPLTPHFKTVIVTEALKRVLQTSDRETITDDDRPDRPGDAGLGRQDRSEPTEVRERQLAHVRRSALG